MTERDELMSEIEHTREELAETVSELVQKMDVKAQAKDKVHEVGEHAAERYHEVKAAAPQPVQKGLDKAEADPKRTAMIVGGVLLLLLIVRRVRR